MSFIGRFRSRLRPSQAGKNGDPDTDRNYLFNLLKTAVDEHLDSAREGGAEAMAKIAEAHTTATHLVGICFPVAHAWVSLACERPDATEAHREEKQKIEKLLDDKDREVSATWLPIIRERLAKGAAPGKWTATISPDDTDFVQDWLAHHAEENASPATPGSGWSTTTLFDYSHTTGTISEEWAMIRTLLAAATTEHQHRMIGYIDLERFVRNRRKEAVDLIVPELSADPKLRAALSLVKFGRDKNDRNLAEYLRRRLSDAGLPTRCENL